jgi:hypothetical protein
MESIPHDKPPRPKQCRLDNEGYCSNWKENMLSNCRGCPYLKDEYQAEAIGRFGNVNTRRNMSKM